jgi:hypothetical protein
MGQTDRIAFRKVQLKNNKNKYLLPLHLNKKSIWQI